MASQGVDKPSAGPTGQIADERRARLREIVSKKLRQDLNVDQFIADIENLDALKTKRPDWIDQLENAGAVKLRPATTAEFFQPQITDKNDLERVREGLTALKRVFDRLPPERRRELAIAAFLTAQEADATADVALQILFETVLAEVKDTITQLSRSKPPSDGALQRKTRIMGVAAAFHQHGVPIGVGPTSPFVSVCKLFGVSRMTVQKYLPQIKKNLDQITKDMYGP